MSCPLCGTIESLCTCPPELEQTELIAWIGEDEFVQGFFGLKQGVVPAGTIPIVVVKEHEAKLTKYWEQAEAQATAYGKKIYLCRFKLVEVLRETAAGK